MVAPRAAHGGGGAAAAARGGGGAAGGRRGAPVGRERAPQAHGDILAARMLVAKQRQAARPAWWR